MALKIKNLRLSPYSQKDNIKVIFGDELHLSFEIPHVDGESYLCALDNERILYPINRPVCAYTNVFTRDGDDVDFTLKLTTSKLRDYVSSIRKPMPVWLQIVREVNGKYETVLLDDILAIPSVIDGNMTVYEGDSFKELLDGKMDVPEAEGTAGQVLTMDADGHYSWQDAQGGGDENVQADWDESDSTADSYIKNKPTIPTVNDGKITVNQGGVKKGEFTVNQNGDTTIDLNDGAQSDWDESDSSNVSFIKNKPNLATVATSGSYNDLENKPIITQPVNADWDESDSENLAYIFNKPNLATVATSGSYNDLTDKPEIPEQEQADWDESDSSAVDYIKNKPALATVATTGSYTDLSNKPVIPYDALDYLCFEIADTDESDSIDPSFALTSVGTTSAISLEISHDKQNWAAYTVGNELFDTIAVGNKVWIRGDNATFSTDQSNYYKFVASSVSVKASGNIMSLLSKDCSKTDVPANAFSALFRGMTGLLTAPEFPAATVGEKAYCLTFRESGITEAPELPATTLARKSYAQMFQDCASLVTAPSVLPATTLAEQCYANMFMGCTSLVEAPELPATALAKQCYAQMFEGCTSLEKAPELPKPSDATASASNKYAQMFYGCSKLSYIKVRMTSISGAQNWVYGVAATGVFECPAALASYHGTGSIPAGWTVVRYDAPQSDWTQTDTLEASFIKNKPVIPDITDYLCFTAQASNSTVSLVKNGNPYAVTLEYSVDRHNWTAYSFGTVITLANRGDYVCFRGDNPNGFNNSTYQGSDRLYKFVMTGTIAASGNIMSLISKQCKDLALVSYEFHRLFMNCTSLTEAPELPATTLNTYCYEQMFYGCTSLKKVPDFVVTDLVQGCFSGMFLNCTSLTEAPELPATTLAQSCYSGMFQGCTSLTKAPELPATTLANNCYSTMFYGCTSLVEAPELPATTLAQSCYSGMFRGCTSLTEAPELPAMTLADYCYSQMFAECTSLKYAPELPATSTPTFCYQSMFGYCTSLQYLKVGFSSWQNSATYRWLQNVPATGLFVCPVALNTTTRGDTYVPSGWSVTNGANNASPDTTSEVDASSVSNYTVCVGTKQTGVVTVDTALTLNALPNESTEIAYAEIVIDLATGATVTAGSNITFVDTLTENKRNVCVVRWSGGTAKLYVTITEDIPQA